MEFGFTFVPFVVIGGVPFIIIAISIIVSIIRTNRFHKTTSNMISDTIENVREEQEKKSKVSYCKYCGTKIEGDEQRCPSCGAKQTEK